MQNDWTPVVFLSPACGPIGLPPEIVGDLGESPLDKAIHDLITSGCKVATVVFFHEDFSDRLRPKKMHARLRECQVYWSALGFKVSIDISESIENWLISNSSCLLSWDIIRPRSV